MTRMQMVGEIRDMIEALYAQDRFAVVAEVVGGIDRFDFRGVAEVVVVRIWETLKRLL